MHFVKRTFLLALLLVLTGGIHPSAIAQPSLSPADSMLAYRSISNLRVWTFTYQAKDMGRLVSFIDGTEEINGQPAIRINRAFNIDYTLLNETRTAAVEGESYVSASAGYYLGDRITVTTDSIANDLEVFVDDETLAGFFTRGGREVDREVAWPQPAYAWDPNMIDQLELYLAFQPIAVGGSFTDSIFQPQSLLWTRISGYCDDYYYKEIYRNKFDSVFAIHLTEPVSMDLFFTAERELVRADFLLQGIRVYQDVNARAKPDDARAGAGSGRRVSPTGPGPFDLERFGQYAGYLVIGLLGLLFFVRAFFRYVESYLALAIGGVAYLAVLITQLPLQERLLAATGELLTLRDFLFPGAVAAAIQESLKAIAIGVILRLFRPQPGRESGIGAAVGAAFGIVGSCWLAGVSTEPATFWFILRDGAFILFHVVTGFLLGAALGKAGRGWVSMLLLTIVAHFVLRVVLALSFVDALESELVAIMLSAIVLVGAAVTLVLRPRLEPKG